MGMFYGRCDKRLSGAKPSPLEMRSACVSTRSNPRLKLVTIRVEVPALPERTHDSIPEIATRQWPKTGSPETRT